MKLLCSILFFTYFTAKCNCATNNVCATYTDYYTIKDNPNCWYDVAAEGNATDVIRSYGYPLEIHKVTTPDGYILTLFRIPNNSVNSNKGPVFLQHGVLSSAANFLGHGRGSLAFVLADAGYDVWLGNYRGTQYSEGHVNMTVFDKRYWDHSMDELGLYDIPAMLNLVAAKTGQRGNIIYVGHSLGTTLGMIYGSAFPKEAKQTVKLFVLLAPAASLANMISPVRLAVPFAETILSIVKALQLIRVTSQTEPQKHILKLYCLESPVLMEFCLQTVNLFYGPQSQVRANTIPVLFNQFPAGTSLRVIKHASDLVAINFRRYNYDFNNLEKYGAVLPPLYDVSKIEAPVFIMYAANDWACTKKDAMILYNNLSPTAKIYGKHEVTVPNFNHIDFLYGENAKSIVYEPLLKLLSQIS